MYVPSYAFILQRLGHTKNLRSDDEPVKIPLRLLKMLLQFAVASQAFDEECYKSVYDDVKVAVDNGQFESAAQHFLTVGYFEGRINPTEVFNEAWYLDRHQWVKLEAADHNLHSAFEHFKARGYQAGLAPSPQADDELAEWKRMIDRVG